MGKQQYNTIYLSHLTHRWMSVMLIAMLKSLVAIRPEAE